MDISSFNNDRHLKKEELIAYQQGNLSNREMHRLELHFVDCVLCTEALEGLANIDEVEFDKHISNIKVKAETKPEESISIKQLIAIAASVVLIAVVSIVMLNQPKDEFIAENLATIEKEEPLVEDVPKGNSIIATDTFAAPETTQFAAVEETTEKATAKIDSPTMRTEDLQVEEEVAKPLDLAIATSEPDDSSSVMTLANVAIDDSTLSDNISIASIDEQDQEVAARSKKMAAPAAGVESPVLNEVETTAIENQAGNYEVAKPLKGIRSYNRYLKRSLVYPDAAKENNIEGNVVIEVEINEAGKITSSQVLESLGFGCDQEAIRLINDGPDWIPGEKYGNPIIDKVRVTVPFKL
jgi:TonB family protein